MKFLIVDNSVFSQQFTKKTVLKKFPDAELYFALSGEIGCSLFKTEKPDYVITDLLMDGIGGQELVRLILEHDKRARIVVLTSDIQKAVEKEILDMGVSKFIHKPLRSENEQLFLKALEETCR